MHIEQFEDKNLAHYSYAIISDSEKKIILIDPARNPRQYLDYAKENEAQIAGIIETHPHADFVSSHLELHETTGAVIYASKLIQALYPRQSFDDGQHIQSGKIKLSAINTPGHSPDSICIVLEHEGKQKAVFTGDTLFIGDCGRPDLRPGDDNAQAAAVELAKQMYHSLRNKLMLLENDTTVYPAHGAGSLCGKALSKANKSNIGTEKKNNWSLQEQTEEEFIKELLNEQPFVPSYFSFDVELNKKGAMPFNKSVGSVKIEAPVTTKDIPGKLNKSLWVVDIRDGKEFKQGHLLHSINLMRESNFETWLGSIIAPFERFYLAGANENDLKDIIERTAAIGYESHIEAAFIINYAEEKQELLNVEQFEKHTKDYTIIDVRHKSEVREKRIFEDSINIPLEDIRKCVSQIPSGKPIVVHCASGYRSAAASSIIQSELGKKTKVLDLGHSIKGFMSR